MGSEGVIDPAHPISPSTGHESEYDPYNNVRIRIDGSRDSIILRSKLTDLVPTGWGYYYGDYW